MRSRYPWGRRRGVVITWELMLIIAVVLAVTGIVIAMLSHIVHSQGTSNKGTADISNVQAWAVSYPGGLCRIVVDVFFSNMGSAPVTVKDLNIIVQEPEQQYVPGPGGVYTETEVIKLRSYKVDVNTVVNPGETKTISGHAFVSSCPLNGRIGVSVDYVTADGRTLTVAKTVEAEVLNS